MRLSRFAGDDGVGKSDPSELGTSYYYFIWFFNIYRGLLCRGSGRTSCGYIGYEGHENVEHMEDIEDIKERKNVLIYRYCLFGSL